MKERYVVLEIRSFAMNISRIAKVIIDRREENETVEVRIESVEVTGDFFSSVD